ncbi:hypothetical protein [uncultured Ruminococcus sp.]|uniref:hypothetical protein n=1 Tax=uncultured Ruminococcus sp. TaxID=165186 RepID=UPI002588A45D|nr:hypothetical protein [uncultured Ruminococcus sp.]
MKKLTSVLLSVAMLLTMAVMFSGCGGPKQEAMYIKFLKAYGTNGHGVVGWDLNYLEDKMEKAEDQKNEDLYSKYKCLYDYYKNCKLNPVEGENKNLSNGDVVTFKFKSDDDEIIDEDMIKEYNITEDEYTLDEFEFEIKGLKEPKEVEVKKNEIKLNYSGYNGKATVTAECTNSSKVVSCEVSKSDNLSNGDKITVTPSISEIDDTYVLKNPKEKFEFTVSGLPEFSDSLDGIDTSEVDKLMDEFVSKNYFGAFNVGDDIGRTVMSESDIEKYPYDDIPIIKYNQSKLDDNTKQYYKFQRSDRAIYSKKLTVSYTAKADEDKISAKKGDIVKGSERVIIYANVVTVDGKLHLVNPNYGGSDSEPYLTDYKDESSTYIPYDFDHNVIDEIREDSYNTIDQDYNEFIQNNDVGDNSSYVY